MRTGLKIRRRLLTMLSAMTLLFSLIGVRIGNLTLVQG
jgi:cell division protein FtsI/penicillin-binding protein 2